MALRCITRPTHTAIRTYFIQPRDNRVSPMRAAVDTQSHLVATRRGERESRLATCTAAEYNRITPCSSGEIQNKFSTRLTINLATTGVKLNLISPLLTCEIKFKSRRCLGVTK